MKIGELAERSGVSVRSLRYYGEQGLLAPRRDRRGHRVYDTGDVDRVVLIQELFAAGFCSSVIQGLLPEVLDPDRSDPAGVVATLDAARDRLRRELADVQRELDVLDGLRARWALDPDMHVRRDAGAHDRTLAAPPAPADHRSRRLR